jgi:hypothetical protein
MSANGAICDLSPALTPLYFEIEAKDRERTMFELLGLLLVLFIN